MSSVILLWSILWLWQGMPVLEATLLFPAASVFQVTSLVSAPVELPGRKIFWDWGIQMNYDMPYDLQKFTNVPIWPGKWDRKRRDLYDQNRANHSWWHIADKYNEVGTNPEAARKHLNDFTAGEFYYALENLLTSYGFHETCLLRSVCELARHPFDNAHQNLITDILTFVLTPSLHEAFSDTETMYRDVYETAERRGFLHHNCSELYSECKEDLLTVLTNVTQMNNAHA